MWSSAPSFPFFRYQVFVTNILLPYFSLLRCTIPWSFCVFVLWNKNCYYCSQTLRIWPSSISLFKTVANICALRLSCLNRKFVVWSLPRSSHFNLFFGAFVSSLSDMGSNPYWDFFQHRFFIQWAASLHLSFYNIFPKVFYFVFGSCVFHISIWLSKNTGEFLANCSIFW